MTEEQPAVEGFAPGCGLWFGWLLASCLGTGFGWAIGWRASFLLPGPLSTAVIGLTLGVLLGLLQWLVLRGHFRRSGHWVAATALGWTAGFPIGAALGQLFGLTEIWFGALAGAMTGLLLAFFQWLVLRGQVSKAGVWVPASLFAWSSGLLYYRPGVTAAGFLYGILSGIVTGVALVWLLYRPVEES